MHAMRDLHGLALGDFRVLCAVADAGSISAAAASLGFTQSGASRRIAALERAAGTSLLVRLPRGIRLTEAGERLRSRAQELLRTAALAHEELALTTGSRRARLGAFSTANSTVIPRALSRLASAEPGLRMSVREQRSPALIRAVATGAVDIAIVSDYPAVLDAPKEVDLDPLAEEPLVVALPHRHPLAGRPISLADLASARWIEGDPIETPVLLEAASRVGFEPNVVHRVRDWHTKLAYVGAGVGVAVVPGLAAASGFPDVVYRQLPGELPVRTMSWASTPPSGDDPSLALLRSIVEPVIHETLRHVLGIH
jgi:DNA-binding transcriptional LysR family regulator